MKKNNFWSKFNPSAHGPILALAPMAGVSDSAFRLICKKYGADVVYTEMTSADALHYGSKKTMAMLKFDKREKPVVCQLFGKRPEVFPRAIELVEKAGFSGIDINFGCPARKVVAHGGGVTLMKDLEHCRKLIEVVVGHTKLPVSVKIRSGIGSVTAVDFVKAVKGLPIAAIMIHGRVFEKPFIGSPDYAMIKKVKKEFSGIVLGNGGINTPQDAAVMLKKTGVDGLGLARGLYGQPWLFEQIKDFVRTEKFFDYNINSAKGFTAIKKAALWHAKYAYQTKGKWGMVELRKHLCWYFRGFAGAADLRKRLVSVETVSDVEDILKSLKV